MTFKRNLTLALLALSATLPMTLTASIAQAQTFGSYTSAAARVESFSVNQLERVRPGSELDFTLNGTPGAEVTLQIAGATKAVRMTEDSPGRYEGSYTVRSRDRVTAASLVTARLVKDGQAVTASLDQSVVAGARSPAPVAVASIAAFSITAPDRVRPGDDLAFSMTGAPGGKARVAVKGVPADIALREVSRGVYEGSYTVRRQDGLNSALSATGFLMVNKQESSQRFERHLAVASAAPRSDRSVEAPAAPCLNCGVVEAVNRIEAEGEGHNVVGTLAGGVLGGALGHQVGGGRGKDLATVAGALGGAYAGNRVQNNMSKTTEYHVVVRLENGTTQTFKYAADPAIKVSARVKVENNAIVRL